MCTGQIRYQKSSNFCEEKSPWNRCVPPRIGSKRNLGIRNLDFGEVKGQHHVKRAVEVAAAGGHNILILGPVSSHQDHGFKSHPRNHITHLREIC